MLSLKVSNFRRLLQAKCGDERKVEIRRCDSPLWSWVPCLVNVRWSVKEDVWWILIAKWYNLASHKNAARVIVALVGSDRDEILYIMFRYQPKNSLELFELKVRWNNSGKLSCYTQKKQNHFFHTRLTLRFGSLGDDRWDWCYFNERDLIDIHDDIVNSRIWCSNHEPNGASSISHLSKS